MDNNPIIILEDSAYFKKGQIIENYNKDSDGIIVEDKFVPSENFIVLSEALTTADERKIKELIRAQLKALFWNLYTKQSIILSTN